VLRHQPVEQLEIAAGHEQFQAELIELHGVAELRDQAVGAVGVGDIEREDQPLAARHGIAGEHAGTVMVMKRGAILARGLRGSRQCDGAAGEAPVFAQRVAVGHTGDVVRHLARACRIVVGTVRCIRQQRRRLK